MPPIHTPRFLSPTQKPPKMLYCTRNEQKTSTNRFLRSLLFCLLLSLSVLIFVWTKFNSENCLFRIFVVSKFRSRPNFSRQNPMIINEIGSIFVRKMWSLNSSPNKQECFRYFGFCWRKVWGSGFRESSRILHLCFWAFWCYT
jgi:hypothetical protein